MEKTFGNVDLGQRREASLHISDLGAACTEVVLRAWEAVVVYSNRSQTHAGFSKAGHLSPATRGKATGRGGFQQANPRLMTKASTSPAPSPPPSLSSLLLVLAFPPPLPSPPSHLLLPLWENKNQSFSLGVVNSTSSEMTKWGNHEVK